MAQEAVFSREFLILAQPPCDGVARAVRAPEERERDDTNGRIWSHH